MSNPLFGTQFKRRKFGNKPTTYKGSWYQSTKEGKYAQQLDLMKRASDGSQRVIKWEKQVKVELHAHGKHICNMYVDFRVWFADGHDEWHEVKSPVTMTEVWRLKEKLFRAEFPNRLYVVITDVR